MVNFASVFKKLSLDGLGELLRAITFSGEGYGCYYAFNVRQDAVKWSEDKHLRTCMEYKLLEGDGFIAHGEGYTYVEDGITVDCVWSWGGDGTLFFRLSQNNNKEILCLVNRDCKCSDGWEPAEKLSMDEIQRWYKEDFSPAYRCPAKDPDVLFSQNQTR